MKPSLKVQELEELRAEARRLVESVGLDPWPVIFGVVDHDRLNELAAYEGFPSRYPHWSFGMSYDYFRKRSAYGGWWTYELVLNTSPAIAYLRESNTPVENKGVMVHVYAHVDFFKHNRWFSRTRRDMAKMMDQHGRIVENHISRHGVTEVESFIDKALSIQYNIDQHAPFIRRRWEHTPDTDGELPIQLPKLVTRRTYMDRFLNPPAWVSQRTRQALESRERRQRVRDATELERPSKDLLWFLMHHGRLQDWQKDILSMIREESYYFAPQVMTKIMNEGWASYWQSHIMSKLGFARESEVIDHADMMSKVLGGTALNPYHLGQLIWRDIKDRWDRGRFGRDWELCRDREAQRRWDNKAALGTDKMFEVRRNHNDVTFLAEFFTEELFRKLDVYAYEYVPETGAYHITSRRFEDVKRKLLLQLTNLGRPTIRAVTGNYGNKGELLLTHQYNGVGLHLEDAKEVLKNMATMWGRPVNLKTIIRRRVKDPDPRRNRIHPEQPQTAKTEEQGVLLRYDGESFRELALSAEEVVDIRLDENYDTTPAEWIG